MSEAGSHHLPNGFGQTHIGLVRARNEDNFLCDNRHRVYAVADGLGGLPQGDVASKIAIEELKKILKESSPADAVLDWEKIFNILSKKVSDAGDDDGEINIGTTLTVMQVLPGNKIHIGHVGDSGIFRFSKKAPAEKITNDHTLAQEEIDEHGITALKDMPDYYKHTLTRCIGQPSPLEVDTFDLEIAPGERILLYTDGVTKTWNAAELHAAAFNAQSPEEFVSGIITTANAKGGPDNVTGVAVFF